MPSLQKTQKNKRNNNELEEPLKEEKAELSE